jgi:hypothetical protein
MQNLQYWISLNLPSEDAGNALVYTACVQEFLTLSEFMDQFSLQARP